MLAQVMEVNEGKAVEGGLTLARRHGVSRISNIPACSLDVRSRRVEMSSKPEAMRNGLSADLFPNRE
jgi:hypothetical protein